MANRWERRCRRSQHGRVFAALAAIHVMYIPGLDAQGMFAGVYSRFLARSDLLALDLLKEILDVLL